MLARKNRVTPFFLILLQASCGGTSGPPETRAQVSPQARAEALLIHLAGMDVALAGPHVSEISRMAQSQAAGMATLEDAEWAMSLLNERDWWLSEDPNTRLLNTGGLNQILTEARQMNPGGGLMTEDQQREQRAFLASEMAQVFVGDGGAQAKAAHEKAMARQHQIQAQKAEERRMEMEEALRWARFVRTWSIYFEAAASPAPGPSSGPIAPEIALDQAVTMSLVRPDLLERLATLVDSALKG